MSIPLVRLGTRSSPLARWQAEWVAARLRERNIAVDLILITTQGDVKTGPLGQIGGQGLFTKEIQRALLDEKIDLAVHSLKDLPTEPVPGLTIAAVPPRESTADVLVSNQFASVAQLPPNARIGTGSLRRKAQLLHQRPDLAIEDIRGNVETRLKKLDDGEFDAIVLAEAGLKRLGFAKRITSIISPDQMLPAIGQGALALETRTGDSRTRELLAPLDHLETHQSVLAERALLAALRAGCLAPVGAHGRIAAARLALDAVVLSPDGRQRLFATGSTETAAATSLGQQLAHELLSQGAAALIAAARTP
jgi:hydroxymethylbilane synthase